MKLLSKKITNKLIKKKLTISVAESCTGGKLSAEFTSVKDSSKIFEFGLVTYSNKSKVNILKIPKKIIREHGTVSERVCLIMLKNLRKIGKTNISISITGIAGPGGGTKKKPIGLVFVGIKKANKIIVKKYLFKNKGRPYIQKAAVNKSFGLILSFLK